MFIFRKGMSPKMDSFLTTPGSITEVSYIVNKPTKNKSHEHFQLILFFNRSQNKHYNCDPSPSCKVCEIFKVRRAVAQEFLKRGKYEGLRVQLIGPTDVEWKIIIQEFVYR